MLKLVVIILIEFLVFTTLAQAQSPAKETPAPLDFTLQVTTAGV